MLLLLGIGVAAVLLTVVGVVGRDEDFRTLMAIVLEDKDFHKMFAKREKSGTAAEKPREQVAEDTAECDTPVGIPAVGLSVRSAALGK